MRDPDRKIPGAKGKTARTLEKLGKRPENGGDITHKIGKCIN